MLTYVSSLGEALYPIRQKYFGHKRAVNFAEDATEAVNAFKEEILFDLGKYGGSSPEVYETFEAIKKGTR